MISHTFLIKGSIFESGDDVRPIIGATVKLENTTIGCYASKDGSFILKNVPHGYENLLVTAVGFKSQRIKLNDSLYRNGNYENVVIYMQKSDILKPEVVVTATRSEKLYDDVPVKVSVITDKIFESTSSLNLKDGLSFQPGLRVETNCQNCGFAEIRMNGLEGKYSQVLIDGKPIYSSLNGVYGLEQIPSNMIERVEIVRGGGSALYGGNSIAGIVNIITKTPGYNFFTASANYSTIGKSSPDVTLQLNSAIVNENEDLGVHIFGMNRSRSEWDANDDGFTEVGRLNVKNLGASFFYKPDHKSKVTMEYHTIYHEIRGGDSLDLPPHESNITETTQNNTNLLQLQYERFLGSYYSKISFYASGQLTDRKSYYGSGKDPNAYGTTDNNTVAAGVQYSFTIEDLAGSHILTAGAEYNRDEMTDIAPAYLRTIDQTATNTGFYIQDDWDINKNFCLVAGSRFDLHNLINGAIISPRFNLLYKASENFNLRTNFSTGFRAPQAFDEDLHITQVGGTGMVIRIAEHLKPEYSISTSFSADFNFTLFDMPFSISNEYFFTKLDNVFILEEAGSSQDGFLVLERRNGKSANVLGTTLELMAQFDDAFNFKGGITWQNSIYRDPVEWAAKNQYQEAMYSDKILRTPELYSFFSAQYNFSKNFNISLSGVHTGSMLVPHFAGGIDANGRERNLNELKASKSFFEVNSMLTYIIKDFSGIELKVGCQNLFNSFQTDFDSGVGRDAGYIYGPSRPRTFFIGIKTQFN